MHDNSNNVDFSQAKHKILLTDTTRIFECYFFPAHQPPPEGLGKMQNFFFIWQEKVNNGKLPKWSDFTFEDFKDWHSYMRVIKCGELHDKPDEVLIAGENFIQYWGRKSMSEQIREGRIMENSVITKFHEYLKLLYNHNYVVCIGKLPIDEVSYQKILFLDLPLSDNSKDVSHAISAILPFQET